MGVGRDFSTQAQLVCARVCACVRVCARVCDNCACLPGCLNNASGDGVPTSRPPHYPAPLPLTPTLVLIHFHSAPPPLKPSWWCSDRPPSISHLSLHLAPSCFLYRSTTPTAVHCLTCHCNCCCSLFVSACLGASLSF